jgi:hypothetical protein
VPHAFASPQPIDGDRLALGVNSLARSSKNTAASRIVRSGSARSYFTVVTSRRIARKRRCLYISRGQEMESSSLTVSSLQWLDRYMLPFPAFAALLLLCCVMVVTAFKC